MKKYFYIVFALILFSISISSINAQTPFRGTVVRLMDTYEAYYDVSLEPGETYTARIIVQHEYEDPNKEVEIYIDATDFDVDEETGETIYPENTYEVGGEYSLASWITFDQDYVFMDTYGQKEIVTFTVTVPEDATPGTKYANIIASNTRREVITGEEELDFDAQGAGIASRLVAATILVTVEGELNQQIVLDSVDVVGLNNSQGLFGFIHELHPIFVIAKINNVGNQVLLPGGDVFIHSGDKTNPLYSKPLNEERFRILPNKSRNFVHRWDDSTIQLGTNGIFRINMASFPKLNWGRYYAEVNFLARDNAGQLQYMTETVEFWVLPWKLILLITIPIVGYFIYRFYKYRKSVKDGSGKRSKVRNVKSKKDSKINSNKTSKSKNHRIKNIKSRV